MAHEEAALLQSLAWPASRLGEATAQLAQWTKLLAQPPAQLPPSLPAAGQLNGAGLDRWLDLIATHLGLEVEPVHTTYAEVDALVAGAGPALVRLPNDDPAAELSFLAIVRGGARRLVLLTPELTTRRASAAALATALRQPLERPLSPSIDSLLASANVPAARRPAARRAIFTEQLGQTPIRGCWLLRLTPGAPLERQVRLLRLPGLFARLLACYLAQIALTVLAWWMVGQSALAGRFEWGWLLGWALLLVTVILFQVAANDAQDDLTIGLGQILKQRLLYGALRLDPNEVRHQGVGQFFGRVLESDIVEQLALAGGFATLLAWLQLGAALAVLALGAGGWLHASLLTIWSLLAILLGWRWLRRNRAWIKAYRAMTNDLVERMVGHRTRLAQESPAHWHGEEDQALQRHLRLAGAVDQAGVQLNALIPRGWLVIGLAALAYRFVTAAASPAQIAISLGGILLAYQALTRLVAGMQSIIQAILAWREIEPLFVAAARPQEIPAQDLVLMTDSRQTARPVRVATPDRSMAGQMLLRAHNLDFRYYEGSRLVLQACSVQIQQGDRLLLEGPSGGGKSTLAALLAGLRSPSAGLLLLWGFDRQTTGQAEWRRRVVAVPQFHENHVLTGTLAFNLLMGRRWPPQAQDLIEAEAICHELGLGDLLARMPAGMQQMVGESGWRLSHGERSRLYMARALLQAPELMIFDESFAALDPENLRLALECVLRRAPTVCVIAHP